jgi:excisionase family DNA binding protein
MERLLTTAEVAELVRAPQSTVRYWRHIRQGPPWGKVGRRVLYRESDVAAWIDQQLTGSVA